MIKIYIATHKKTKLPKIKNYVPIQVGASLHDDLGYLKDNTGDNISDKNTNFCELTALYWIWKNDNKSEYVGLSHYRRYFFYNNENSSFKNIIKTNDFEKIFLKYDIIVPKKLKFGRWENVKKQYYKSHNTDDLLKCGKIIEKIYPEYSKTFKRILRRNYLYAFNMFVMKKKDFNDYMDWLFNIFNEFSKDLDLSKYDNYNRRVYGFLSERLFNVWIEKNKLRKKEVDVMNIDENTFL